jgi:hypothetical protein
MKGRFSLENLSQTQFDYILNMMVMYKQLNPNKDVYLTDSGISQVLRVFNKSSN